MIAKCIDVFPCFAVSIGTSPLDRYNTVPLLNE